MARINLDPLARARMEKAGKKRHEMEFAGVVFQLPPELPLSFAIALSQGDLDKAVREVLDGRADEFLALGPSVDDFRELAENVTEVYAGRSVGESSASASSSKKTPTRSRPISSGSTT